MDVSQYEPRVREIIASADLTTLTAKHIRKQLEREFKVDLSQSKKAVDHLVMKALETVQQDSPSNEEKAAESDSMSELEDEPGPKRLKSAVTVSKDEAFARKLANEDLGLRNRRRATAKPKPASSSTRKSDKPSVFQRPVSLSSDLSAFMGRPEAPRPDVVKAVWTHIKEHNLQDPSDKRFILCDDTLKALFDGKERVHSFGMNKHLSKHMKNLSEVTSSPPKDASTS